MARWARRRVPAGRVLVIASQQRGVLERYGISRAEAEREAWAVDRDGRRFGGAAAVNRLMREAGGVWPALARPYGLRPVGSAEEAFYRWFARHRSAFHRFGVRPECDEPGSGCE